MSTAGPLAPRRRLLFLLPFPPRLDASHGGGRVAAQLIHALSGRHEVAALYLRAHDEPAIDERVADRCSLVGEIAIPREPSFRMRLARHVAPLRGVPAWAAFVAVPEFARRAHDVARSWRPDVVHLEYHVMGQYAAALDAHAGARILTEYEAGVLAAREHMWGGRDPRSLSAWLERRAWVRFERRVIADVDAVVVFAERDRLALEPIAGTTPIVRIGIGVQLPPMPADPVGSAEKPELLFVGSFAHPPNVDAALRLAEQIFPRVRAHVLSATLRIVGPAPPPRLRAAAGHGVHVTGRVPDVTPWLDAAALVVVPLRVGGGMRVKVLEALAHGKAVIASARAVDGLALHDRVHVALAESDDDFVERIVGLLGAPDERRALATNARAWACAHLGEERWVAEYEALYDRLLGDRLVAAREAWTRR